MISNKNKKYLRSLANTSTHKYQIGKEGVDNDVITLINNALKAHELIKVYFNKAIAIDRKELTDKIIKMTNSILVGEIGHMIIIYRENLEKKNRIILN